MRNPTQLKMPLLKRYFKYYPQNDIAARDLAKAAAEEDAAKRYKAYEFCSTVQYKPWEKQRPIVLRRGIDDK